MRPDKPVLYNEPEEGERIVIENGKLKVPDYPIIPYIEGDGVGPEITASMIRVLDAAVKKVYGNSKKIIWMEVYAGSKAYKKLGEYLPEDTVNAIGYYTVGIKGPLTTPVGGGYRSLNVTIRQTLDLYACIRPCKYYGAPSPVKHPEKLDVVIFRENTEDVYAGIEWDAADEKAKTVRRFLAEEFGINLPEDSGIGIKPISRERTRRLVRKAINYAIENGYRSVTLVHKGNIQKFTEGAFRKWGYELAAEEFADVCITEKEVKEKYGGTPPSDKIIIKDRIADAVFHDMLIKPEDFDVIATTNLNGDYISDAAAAQVGGLGIAPGANIGDYIALFEATHGTAPLIAGKNVVNPCSLILSGAMMLDYLGWKDAAEAVRFGVRKAIYGGKVTPDFAGRMENAEAVGTDRFTDIIIEKIGG